MYSNLHPEREGDISDSKHTACMEDQDTLLKQSKHCINCSIRVSRYFEWFLLARFDAYSNLAVMLQEKCVKFKLLFPKVTLLFQNYSWFFLPPSIPKLFQHT